MTPPEAPEDRNSECPIEKDLLAFHQRTLEDPRQFAAIRWHLIGCTECHATLRDLADEAEFRELLAGSDPKMSPRVREEIVARALKRLAEGGPDRDPKPRGTNGRRRTSGR